MSKKLETSIGGLLIVVLVLAAPLARAQTIEDKAAACASCHG
jgi:cytochrome c553